jgi:hypothetical protein
MSLSVARLALRDEQLVKLAMREILSISHLRGEDWQVTSPAITSMAWQKIREISGQDDPLLEDKVDQNIHSLLVYEAVKENILRGSDPFLQALKFSVAGNSVDSMIRNNNGPTDGLVESLSGLPIDVKCVLKFRDRINKSHKIVYFTDNCGEIIFDKLFLEAIRLTFQGQITIVTRSLPVLNDATMRDAIFIGLDEVATLMENGIKFPFPGTIISELSPEVRALVEDADLIISKGVGNYDSLTEETQLLGKVSFLFHGKCLPVCASSGASLGSLIVINS